MTAVLAEARRRLTEAECRYQEATERATKIRQRIADCEQRQRDISAQRLEGEAGPETAAEYAALGGDIETLRGMLAEAEASARNLEPVGARNQLALAERNAERELAHAEFEALTATSAKLEAALLDCIRRLHEIGKARLGHVGLSQSWRSTEELRRVMHYGVPPGGQ